MGISGQSLTMQKKEEIGIRQHTGASGTGITNSFVVSPPELIDSIEMKSVMTPPIVGLRTMIQQTIDNQVHIRKVLNFFNQMQKHTIFSHFARGESIDSLPVQDPKTIQHEYQHNVFRPNTSGMHQRAKTMAQTQKKGGNLFLKPRR